MRLKESISVIFAQPGYRECSEIQSFFQPGFNCNSVFMIRLTLPPKSRTVRLLMKRRKTSWQFLGRYEFQLLILINFFTLQILKYFKEKQSIMWQNSTLTKIPVTKHFLQGESEYEEWKYHKNKNIVEVIQDFSSLTVPAALLLAQLPRLQPVSDQGTEFPVQSVCRTQLTHLR